MPSFLATLVNIIAWIYAAIVTAVISTISLVIILPISYVLDRNRLVMHNMAKLWAKCLIGGHPFWHLYKEGLKNFSRKRTYVIVANHQSIVDILVVLAAVPLNFKFIAKKELFKIPSMGWHMWGADYIGLERGNPKSAKEVLEKSRMWIDRKVSILIFPEGTRSENGEIHHFKNGAFKLAIEKKIPILPVIIDGTGATSPKKSTTVSKTADLAIEICKPIEVCETDTVEALKEQVHSLMVHKLAEMRACVDAAAALKMPKVNQNRGNRTDKA